MDENNNNDDMNLNVKLGVEEDKGVGAKINTFKKKLGLIPEEREVELRYRADFRKTNAELNKNLKHWQKVGKHQVGNPVANYFFGNKNKVRATKQLFVDLEKTARRSVNKYNNELNAMLGADRKQDKNGNFFGFGGEMGETRDSFRKAMDSKRASQKELNKLTYKYNLLLQKQDKLGLMDDEKSTIQDMEKQRANIKDLENTRDKEVNTAFDTVQPMKVMDIGAEELDKKDLEVFKLAGGYFSRTNGNDKLYKQIEKDISNSIKNDEEALKNVAAALRKANGKTGGLKAKLNNLIKEQRKSPSAEIDKKITDMKTAISKNNADIKKYKRDELIGKKYLSIDKKRMANYQEHYDNRNKPQDFANDKNYKTEEFPAKFDKAMRAKTSTVQEMVNNVGKLTTPKSLDDINNKINNAYDSMAKLQIKMQEITSKKAENKVNIGENDSKDTVSEDLKDTKKSMKESEAEIAKSDKAARKLLITISRLRDTAKDFSRQLRLISDDTKINPFENMLESNDLSKYNDKVDDIKTGVENVGSNWKKSNVFTRLGSRMLINIRSQIADMFNPFTNFRRGFEQWLNRWNNLPWKNTFDVIAYNLVSIMAPVFEWMSKALIKVAQVFNVATKKWFGVDLFDKSAWSLEQINKGMGQLTASFDELHSNTDNPNQLNTIFDTDPAAISPLSEDVTKKIEKWADRIAGAFKLIKDNWMLLVGAWAAFKLAKGMLSILDWASKLSDLFGVTLPLSLGKFLAGLSIAAGIAAGIYSGYNTWKLGSDWDQMDDKEKNDTMGKSMGFGTLAGALIGGGIGFFAGGGPAGAAIGATIGAGIGAGITGGIDSAIADYNGDDARAEIAGAIGGAGTGAAIGGTIGATIGTTIAPVLGTAIGAAIGTAIGGAVGWGAEKLGHLGFSNGGDYSNLKISADDAKWATEQLTEAQQNNYNALYQLKQLEEQTGESGKALYEAVQNGSLSYDNMTSSQMAVCDAYGAYAQSLDDVMKKQQQKMDYDTSMSFQDAKKSKDYRGYIDTMLQANEDGIYSTEELQDRLSQQYSELNDDQKKVFVEQLPENMRQGVVDGAQQYLSNWDKFNDDVKENWNNFLTDCGTFANNVGTTVSTKWEELKTNAGNIWEGMKTTAGNVWKSVQIEAGEAWDNIKNSAIGQKVQQIAEDTGKKWEELKTNASKTWEDVKTNASNTWDNIKNSAIGQKTQEIWTNTVNKFNNLKDNITNTWSNLKTSAGNIWNGIKTAITDKVKSIWEDVTGWFSDIGKKAADAWNRVQNFFGGKGFKTDAEYEVYMNGQKVPSYDVGTNYVPNDQLAMIHQGEAIIPAKYNKPYNGNDNSNLDGVISAMTQEIANLRTLVQQGIPVKGEFKQRGSDLVAVVEKGKNKNGNQPLSNPAYAR